MNRRFGIELEITGINEQKIAAALRAVQIQVQTPGYTHRVMASWKIVPDGSVNGGWEVVSPILEGEAGLAEAATVIDALKTAGAKADRSCGMHVHFDMAGLGVNEVRSIVRRYAKFENEIDAFMPRSRRENANGYCRSIRSLVENRSFQNAGNMNELVRAQGGRYFKVNLQSHTQYGTLEFRQHNGIVDADRAMNWVRFLDAFIAESVRVAREPQVAAPVAAAVIATNGNGRLTVGQRRLLDLLQANAPTAEEMARHLGVQIHSARAVVTRIRQAGYAVRVVRRNGEARYTLRGTAPVAAPASVARTAADSLFAGVNAIIATFYRNRAAVLALA